MVAEQGLDWEELGQGIRDGHEQVTLCAHRLLAKAGTLCAWLLAKDVPLFPLALL